MIEKPMGARLCPNCANTIEEEATKCRYCKVELSPESSVPHWLNRNQPAERAIGSKSSGKSKIPTRFIWPATILVLILIAFFIGEYIPRNELALTSQAYSKQLQAKDQMIQDQTSQLNRLRQELNDKSGQLDQMKAQLEENQKASSATQKRLEQANREVDRLNAARSAAVARASSPSSARPGAGAVATTRRGDAGVYETTRETSVYENPSPQARVVSQIRSGTRINVVNSAGDWLEVRSNHGNPTGYIRSDDARRIARN